MKKSGWIGALLFLSLATNAFFAGWVLSPKPTVQPPRSPILRQLAAQVKELPEPARSEARQIILAYRPELRARARTLRQARREVGSLLASPDYTRDTVAAHFERVREETAQLQTLAQRMMLDIADRLPPKERAELVENWGRKP